MANVIVKGKFYFWRKERDYLDQIIYDWKTSFSDKLILNQKY
jgi:hypothetical protein